MPGAFAHITLVNMHKETRRLDAHGGVPDAAHVATDVTIHPAVERVGRNSRRALHPQGVGRGCKPPRRRQPRSAACK